MKNINAAFKFGDSMHVIMKQHMKEYNSIVLLASDLSRFQIKAFFFHCEYFNSGTL